MPEYRFEYSEWNSSDELDTGWKNLLEQARALTRNAYAPYSGFRVACLVLLSDGSTIPGVNIENASYPVGICAERSALSAALSSNPGAGIAAIAVTYQSSTGLSETPAFPCGMCRQFIVECETRNGKDIQVWLTGMSGKVVMVPSARDLLPFSFSGSDLK